MYRVLLPVDENEPRARTQVISVLELPASADELTVDIVHIHEEVSMGDAEWAAGGFSEEYEDEMEAVRENNRFPSSVETAVERLESADVEYTVHELDGDPADAVLAFADDHDSDVIVLGVGNRSPVGKVLFGSVAQTVILESDRPVTVVPADEEET